MQVVIHLEGAQYIFHDVGLPISVHQIKLLFQNTYGVPVRDQRLFYYPDIPEHGPLAGLRLSDDHHSFVENIPEVQFVLTLGGVSMWAHFYVILPSGDGRKAVHRMNSHKFKSIAEIKHRILANQRLPVNGFQLSKENGNLLAENLNLFQCQVENGTNLHYV